jgi:hypothetical protein
VTATRPRPTRRLIALVFLAAVVIFFYIISFSTPNGVGWATTTLGGPSGAFSTPSVDRKGAEVSLARGGLMLVFNGTRTDASYYDDNMGCGYSGSSLYGPNGLYFMHMDRVSAPVVWVPIATHPTTARGLYILIPFWLPLLIIAAAIPLSLRRTRTGCPACGYDLRGLPKNALCPECGKTAPKPSPAPGAHA